MQRTLEQIDANDAIWKLYTDGEPGPALYLAEQYLKENETAENEAFHRHIAMQLTHIHTGLAKQATIPTIVAQHWIDVVETIRHYFPIAPDREKAEKKNVAWKDVLPGETAQIHAWASVAGELELMGVVARSPQLISVSHAVLQHSADVAARAQYGDRTMQIVAIKHGPYEDAKRAYGLFVENYGIGTEACMYDQVIQLSSIMVGRARYSRDEETQHLAEKQLRLAAVKVSDTDDEALVEKLLAKNEILTRVPMAPKIEMLRRAAKLELPFLFGSAHTDAAILRAVGEDMMDAWIGVAPGDIRRVRD